MKNKRKIIKKINKKLIKLFKNHPFLINQREENKITIMYSGNTKISTVAECLDKFKKKEISFHIIKYFNSTNKA